MEYLQREYDGRRTEFRLVVESNGHCYIQVADEESETFDFDLPKPSEPTIAVEPVLCAADLKAELVAHLKTKHIYDITALWGEAKTYYRNQLREMGGSYASWGNSISVRLNNPINNTPIKFDVELDEVR